MAPSTNPDLNLDKSDEVGFVSFFKSLPVSEHVTTSSVIRIFERADFYTAHGQDAFFIADHVYRTTSVIKYLGNGSNAIPSVTMSTAVFRGFLKEALVDLGLKVDIYSSAVGGRSWKITRQASPGNIQAVEDLIAGNIDINPVVIATKVQVKNDQRTVGVCFIDTNMHQIGISEFIDNEVFSNLESLIIQLGVKECILPSFDSSKDFDLNKIASLMERCDIVISERPAKDFHTRDIEQDLTRLLSPVSQDDDQEISVAVLPQMELTVALASTASLIKYLSLMNEVSNHGLYQLVQHDLGQYMRLDSSALRALNLMPSARDGSSKTNSLFGLLNKCKTAAGTRLLGQWLKQPLMDVAEIEKRHVLVEAMIADSGVRQSLQEDLFKVVPDLNKLTRKFLRGAAKLEDVVRVYQMIIRLPDFVNLLSSISEGPHKAAVEEIYINRLNVHLDNLLKLQELVETTVDLEALDNHEFIIKADFDEKLQDIKGRLDQLKESIALAHLETSEDLGMEADKKLKLEHHHVFGWCMRLTRTDAGCLRSKSGYTELSTQKAGVYFTSRALKEASIEFEDLNNEYSLTQANLVKEVVSIASTYCPLLEKISLVLSHLDVIVSFAHVSVFAPIEYVRPKMSARGSGNTILKEARHPCMEAQDDITFIPNDVNLIRGSSEFLIITGPNMGGKSTFIRQIGVIALMAQAGCFVPCTEAELSIYDSVLARVGAGDSQLKGVSTFMAEMLETATILKSATRESLIVIDELGRGTSTYDGFGLAWAISEHIIENIGCSSMFATHFHELTALSKTHPAVSNLHVAAHIEDTEDASTDITLLYKVEEGISDQSFGIHVAEVVNFPSKVVLMAKRKAAELEDYGGMELDSAHAKKKLHKYTNEEIKSGNELLRSVLKKWADSVDIIAESPDVIVQKLNDVMESDEFKSQIDSYLKRSTSQLGEHEEQREQWIKSRYLDDVSV
ncbi:DNA mismatch repair protein msh-2 [Nadsonia fulvescens var. elongata DSM 6958]|uniref:DNA mismatch repair protein msh-2 n=1 Tax=Nadsonia fulvescens var. elongata DSM 6958 TaxID=857566 RepID=A0A1E3PQS8_9ASCO|nr:DNA mismatch repair protein msh-2 [Nadsonia fulvescens var. elongata DSM 6958]